MASVTELDSITKSADVVNDPSIVIVSSVQDFRLKRRGSIQTIAEELARSGRDVTFVSVRFSFLSDRRADPRTLLLDRANKFETQQGVKCFLWRTPFHPFNTHHAVLNKLLTPCFYLYAWYPNANLDSIFRSAKIIIIESGLAIVLVPRIRRLNPHTKLIYRASDRLSAISQHEFVAKTLRKHQASFEAFCLLGPGIAQDFAWAYPNAFVVPAGLNRRSIEGVDDSPYDTPINAVSLGAMLFDWSFFKIAAALLPHITFHIFGVPVPGTVPTNVRFYPDIPYGDTWRYIRHATFGVAAYLNHDDVEYIADTSSKLMQYGAVGLPSICPHFAVGRHPNRFGYVPGDAVSIEAAMKQVLAASRKAGSNYRTWSEIVPRLLAPRDFPDTLLVGMPVEASATPVLSLIVATRGRIEPLARLLSSLRSQPSDLFEVIVVDQNAPGMLDHLLARFSNDLNLVHLSSAPGLSRARNVGLRACRGEIVGFPDDDCWYPSRLIDDVIRFFRAYYKIDICLGQTIDKAGTPSVNPVGKAQERLTPSTVWFSGNSNTLFVRHDLANKLRFDENLGVGANSPFQSGEETDMILRALQGGAAAVYCPNLKIFHEQVDVSIKGVQLRRAWRYSAGVGQVLRRHYSFHYFVYRVGRSLVSGTAALMTGQGSRFVYRLVWSAGTIRGWLQK